MTTLTAGEVSKVTAQLAAYYLQQSGGREKLTYQVFDWFELSLTSEAWDTLGFNVGPVVTAEVAQKLSVDLSSFTHFVLVIDKSGASLAATDPATLKYTHAAAKDLTQAILAHEFGHTYGSNHANLQTPTGPAEYGDNFCVMGREGGKYSFPDPSLGIQGASGPGMVAPNLISCGWLNINDPAVAFNVGQQSHARPSEPVCEIAALRGAPRAGSGLPVVVRADNVPGGLKLLVEFRMADGWDRALPASPASGAASGWIVAHLTNALTPRGTSLQIGAAPADVGTKLKLSAAGMDITVAAVDTARGRVTLQVGTPWFVNPLAVTAFQKDRLDIFGLGADWQMYHKAWTGAGWYPAAGWDALGGSFLSPPSVVSWGPNRLDMFGLGRNRALYHKSWDGNGWHPSPTGWDSLGGVLISPPAVASWGPNRLDIFGVGADSAMYHKAWDGSWYPSPMGWQTLGGTFLSLPKVVSWGPNRLDIFALGADSAMYHKAWAVRAWFPSETAWEALGGAFHTPPTVVSWGVNRLDIFALGLDNALYHKAWDGHSWYPSVSDWELLGGGFSFPPVVASWGPNRLDIFGIGNDQAMYHKAWDGHAWYPSVRDWEPLGGAFLSQPSVASWGPNRLDIFGVGADKGVYHKAWDGRAWHPWETLGGVFS
ncbi:MAG: hypothetical protein ABJA98_25105 [Acidobacteriota bacterium]